MGLFETLNRLGVLSVGRRPEWKLQTTTTGPPASAGAGVSIAGSVKTLVSISLREDAAFHTARVSITYAAATTYKVTVGATALTVAAITDAATTLQSIATAINANPVANLLVLATVEDDQVVIRGLSQAGFAAAGEITAGTGTITVTQDATEATAYVYLLAGGFGARPPQWTLARNGTLDAEFRGLTERLDTAGFDRMYVEVVVDGSCTVHIGPGVVE